MKINALKKDFKTHSGTGKKVRTKFIPVVNALGDIRDFRIFNITPYDSSATPLTEKIKSLPPLLKYYIDTAIRNKYSTEKYRKEYVKAIKPVVISTINTFLNSPITATNILCPGNSANGQEELMNLVGIQHSTYTTRDSKYFAGGYYFLTKFIGNDEGVGYKMSPIFSLMVKAEYVTYLRYCQLFDLEIDNDIFEFWVDEKFDIQDTQYPTLRTCYRKSVKPVLKANNIPVVKKKDMFYEMYQCFRVPDFPTIDTFDTWKNTQVTTFMSKFKKEIPGEGVIFSEGEESEYTIYLHSCGESKLQCVKYIKDFTTLGLYECKKIADNDDSIDGCFLVTKTQEQVEAFIEQLNEIGATASYRQGNQLENSLEELREGDHVVIVDRGTGSFSEGTIGILIGVGTEEDSQVWHVEDEDGYSYWYYRYQIRRATQLEIDRARITVEENEVTDVDFEEVTTTDRPFQVGDTVELIANTNCSYNAVGDIGIITELHNYGGELNAARVSVNGNTRNGNWSLVDEIRLVTSVEPTPREQVDPNDLAELASIQSELTPIERSVAQVVAASPIAVLTEETNSRPF